MREFRRFGWAGVLCALAVAICLVSTLSARGSEPLTPVVLFPAFHFTKLEVTVRDQTAVPGCPREARSGEPDENRGAERALLGDFESPSTNDVDRGC
jgi:hypothetical protein